MKRWMMGAAALLAVAMLASCTPRAQGGGDTAEPTGATGGDTAVSGVPDTTKDVPGTAGNGAETTDLTAPSGSDGREDTTASDGKIGEEAALAAAKNYLGDRDPNTGYLYSYSAQEMLTDNGVEYYKIRVSWYLEEDDRYATCGYLLVRTDGSSVTKFDW